MRKLPVFLCLFFCVAALHARAIQEDYKEADEKARVSYAFGMVIGSNYGLKGAGLEFDYSAFAEGLRATMEDDMEPQFTEQEAREIIETALYNVRTKVADENRLIEEKFLAENSQRPEVQVTPSGLQYEILEEANGEKPERDSVVRIYYVGNFLDGKPFDSVTEGEGELIPLDMVFPGLAEGITLMSVGSQYRFYIPSELAYGNDSYQPFPPYSTLIFTVELLEITEEEPDFWQ
jgi:FKBP-type peptidyl-prolyl cis-trans isomerase